MSDQDVDGGQRPRGRAVLWVMLAVGVLVGVVLIAVVREAGEAPTSDLPDSAAGATSTDVATSASPESPESTEGTPSPAPMPAGTPGAAVETLLEAIADGDCAAATAVVTDSFLEHNGECSTALPEQFAWFLGEETVDDATSTATVVCMMGGEEQREEYRFHLVVEDGAWKVDTIS